MAFYSNRSVDQLLVRRDKKAAGAPSRSRVEHMLLESELSTRSILGGTELVIFSTVDHRVVARALVLTTEDGKHHEFRIKGDSKVCVNRAELVARARWFESKQQRLKKALLASRTPTGL